MERILVSLLLALAPQGAPADPSRLLAGAADRGRKVALEGVTRNAFAVTATTPLRGKLRVEPGMRLEVAIAPAARRLGLPRPPTAFVPRGGAASRSPRGSSTRRRRAAGSPTSSTSARRPGSPARRSHCGSRSAPASSAPTRRPRRSSAAPPRSSAIRSCCARRRRRRRTSS
jgi:hypothetical protein